MKFSPRALLLQFPLAVVLLTSSCFVGALPPADTVRLSAYSQAPDAAGELVYRGATFSQRNTAAQTPLYRYERRVAAMPTGAVATHATADAMRASSSLRKARRIHPAYELQRFDVVNVQAGYSGSAVVSSNGFGTWNIALSKTMEKSARPATT